MQFSIFRSACFFNLSLLLYFPMSKQRRERVIFLHERGTKTLAIANQLRMPVQTVRHAIKQYKEVGGPEDRPKSGRPVTATTPANREKIRKRIKQNSELSMRGLAKSMQISDRSVRIIVGMQLGIRSRKLSKGQLLTEPMKEKRLQKSRNMLRLVAKNRHRTVVFTDEKIFTVEHHHNRQNNCQLLPKGSRKSCLNVSYLFYSFSEPKIVTRSIRHGVGRNHVDWQDAVGFR